MKRFLTILIMAMALCNTCLAENEVQDSIATEDEGIYLGWADDESIANAIKAPQSAFRRKWVQDNEYLSYNKEKGKWEKYLYSGGFWHFELNANGTGCWCINNEANERGIVYVSLKATVPVTWTRVKGKLTITKQCAKMKSSVNVQCLMPLGIDAQLAHLKRSLENDLMAIKKRGIVKESYTILAIDEDNSNDDWLILQNAAKTEIISLNAKSKKVTSNRTTSKK